MWTLSVASKESIPMSQLYTELFRRQAFPVCRKTRGENVLLPKIVTSSDFLKLPKEAHKMAIVKSNFRTEIFSSSCVYLETKRSAISWCTRLP